MTSVFLGGASMREFTPSAELLKTAGFSTQDRGSPLRVKALALSMQGDTRVLLALDLVYALGPQARFIREAAAQATGLRVEDIVLAPSHSHSTPCLESSEGPHPFLDFVATRCTAAAVDALGTLRPARAGCGRTHVAGASFNTRVPMPDGGAKFTRDYREGLASGRPVDPRLSVLRFDDERGQPIAGWVRFAAHPACVIFDAPLSAEYPGYLTDQLSGTVGQGAPVLFGYGASGDVNCVPMFGKESDARQLGLQLAAQAAPLFESIQTRSPERFRTGCRRMDLPLDRPPSVETLDREIAEVERFIADLDRHPELEWVIGINCKREWPVERKKRHAQPLADWARLAKQRLLAGEKFPEVWPRHVTVWILDDLGLVFDPGETLTEVSLALAARSPLAETLLLSLCNGADAYLGTDEDRRRGGYEMYTSTRYARFAEGTRPLPYALGAAEAFIGATLELIRELAGRGGS